MFKVNSNCLIGIKTAYECECRQITENQMHFSVLWFYFINGIDSKLAQYGHTSCSVNVMEWNSCDSCSVSKIVKSIRITILYCWILEMYDEMHYCRFNSTCLFYGYKVINVIFVFPIIRFLF